MVALVSLLNFGKPAVVDDDDADRVTQHLWRAGRASQVTERYYVYAHINGPKVYLHRFVLNAPAGVLVDHKNNDGLDNRRANIRFATRSQNNANRASFNPSGFRGVRLTPRGFRAMISAPRGTGGRKCAHLGYFSTAEEAAQAYDRAALHLFGEFARPNFPPVVPA